MVRVAVRLPVPVLAATLKVAEPLPVPLPATTVTQVALLVADHAQPAVVVTDAAPDPPALANDWLVGEMLNAQLGAAAAWLTVNVCPATVSVADRVDVAVFAAAVKLTEPLPEPDAPAVIVTHPALLAAVHEQPAVVVTATVPEPPAAAKDWLAGEILNAQLAPACVTVNVLPATVNVPVRGVVAVVAAAVKLTDPLPVPLAPALIVSHATLLVADHAHPAPAVTPTVPLPPAAATDCDTGEIKGAHGGVNAKVLDGWLGLVPPGPTADTRVS
jgi:hypothetical protein